jgi:predicted ATPase
MQGAALVDLAKATELYQGELLAGFYLQDAVDFEDWQLITREQLHEQMMLALKTLQVGYAEQGRWVDLAEIARRQLAVVPWTEAAHRYLIQALAAQGQTQAALAQFEKCRAILQEELGVEPSPATLELVARLRSGGSQGVQHNLTQQLKAFVGRNLEVEQLKVLVRQHRVVTLLGIGGVGKSHLAQTVAQNVLPDFEDGVWFVPLTNVEAGEAAPERIALAVAAALNFAVTDMQNPLAQLAAHLAHKRSLLVLDNWEHLVDSAPPVLEALLQDNDVHVLATSRVRLMMEGERIFPLEGLPRPEAYRLFVERARRVVPSFAGAEGEEGKEKAEGEANAASALQADVLRICDQVAGLPLGIELAASWVEHYSVAEIGQFIGDVEVQPQRTDGLLHRHHRLSSVFEFSWQLLSPRQQQILARLSVFRGGFDRVAVTTVAESSLNDLSVLIAHSLVQRVVAGRYNLHPLIQEFAGQKLASDQAETLYRRYLRHYLSTLMATAPNAWRTQLSIEFENIRSAWQRALEVVDADTVDAALTHFCDFMRQFGLLVDSNALFAETVTRFEAEAGRRELVARLLDKQAFFVRSLAGLKAAAPLHQRVLDYTSDPQLQAISQMELANYCAEIGDWAQFDRHVQVAEEAGKKSDDPLTYIEVAEAHVYLKVLHFRGDFGESLARLEALLPLLETIEATAGTPLALNVERYRTRILQSIGTTAIRYGDYASALRYMRHALKLAEEGSNHQRRAHLLLDLALAEQFAGLYADAVAHNREALAFAEATGDIDDGALLRANLCLTMRQHGELQSALAYGLKAIEELAHLGNKRIEGQARNRTGHTYLALGRWADAYAMYGSALEVWNTMQHPNRFEAVAGLAVAALHQGKHDEALALANETMRFVEQQALAGIVEPAQMLLNCELVYRTLGHGDTARATLLRAGEWVRTIAQRISDDGVREAYLTQRPDTRRVQALLVEAQLPAPR